MRGGSKESSKKKKAAKEDLGPLTIPQREQRALEQLGNYLEEVGGGYSSLFLFGIINELLSLQTLAMPLILTKHPFLEYFICRQAQASR